MKYTLLLLAALSLALPGGAVQGSATEVFGVRQLMNAPEVPQGDLMVEGIVSQTFPDQKMLALIDLAEFEECRVLTCAQLTLPVYWTEHAPEVGSAVRINGRIETMEGRMLFVANTLETFSPPPGKDQ